MRRQIKECVGFKNEYSAELEQIRDTGRKLKQDKQKNTCA